MRQLKLPPLSRALHLYARLITLLILATTAYLTCLADTGHGFATIAQQPVHIEVVRYPRPVAAAVLQVEKHFGQVVTYEDTLYLHPSEIEDVTELVRRDGNMARRVFQMRGGSINLVYTPRQAGVEAQVGEVLQEVLAASRAAGNAGDFRVERALGAHHVVPVTIKNRSGLIQPYTALLDTHITLPDRKENGVEFLSRIARAVTTASGRTLSPGTMPINRLLQARIAVDASRGRARDVLWRTLQSIGHDLSWQLLCGVGESATCTVNIHLVQEK